MYNTQAGGSAQVGGAGSGAAALDDDKLAAGKVSRSDDNDAATAIVAERA